MDYEICKKLEEAGFPQELKMGHWICEHNLLDPNITEKTDNCHGEQLIYRPTLEELIEACGDEFGSLTMGIPDKDWFAHNNLQDDDLPKKISKYGETPSEAVANLWLKLNEK